MAAAKDALKGAPQAASSDAALSEFVDVEVLRGTIHTDEGKFGPGETARVARKCLPRLQASGHVQGDDYVEPEETQDGKLRVTAQDGPNVTTSP